VTCVDLLADRVAAINRGEPPIHEPKLEDLLQEAITEGRLNASTDLREAVASSQISLIAVGTPFAGDAIDLSQVAAAAGQIGEALGRASDYHVVVVKSTVVPGTTDTLVAQTLEKASRRRLGDFGLCMNPEFLRESSAIDDFMDPDRIVVGQWDARSGQALAELYQPFHCPKIFTTLRNAELIKYASNALLATLVSFSNEIAALCEATPGTDIEVVMQELHLDRRLSPVLESRRITPGILSYLRAGCGFGGSCLPKDVNALRAYARGRGVKPDLLDAVMAVNNKRPTQLVDLAEQTLGSLRKAEIAVLGLAFKPGTDDIRDSPALAIINHLLDRGAAVRVYDPVATKTAAAVMKNRVTFGSTPTEVVREADAVLIATAWPDFQTWDWADLCQGMRRPVIVDGRNALRGIAWPPQVVYVTIGRTVHQGKTATPLERAEVMAAHSPLLDGAPG
jgi:UDPglucose 6-dehydrogenase/GDP-mannose 6-dehydrogenase